MNFETVSQEYAGVINALARQCGLSGVRLFGSAARGEAGPGSDIDLLVEASEGVGLLALARFERLVSEAMGGRKVQAISRHGLSPLLRDRILAEARPL